MDIRELRCAHTIASERTLSRAAERLDVSRQAVAKTLRHIERQTGYRLFERRDGTLVPTEQGTRFLEASRELIDAFDEFCRTHLHPLASEYAGAAARGVQREVLSVALVTGGSVGLPHALFEDFMARCPSVSLSIEEMNTDAVLGAVANGNADIGIVGTHPDYVAEFDSAFVLPVGIWLRLPAGHPLAGRDRLVLHDLDGQPMVTAGPHNHLHRFVMDRCINADVHPIVQAQTTEARMIKQLAREVDGMYFTFPPNLLGRPDDGTVVLGLTVSGGDLFGTYAIRRRTAHLRHAARLFWEYVQGRGAPALPA